MFFIITQDHKHTWVIPCPFQCSIFQYTFYYFCSGICTAKNTTWMRNVTTRRRKYHQQSKMRTSSPQKLDSIGLTWFRESNWFHQCRINFYQPETFSSLSLAFKKPLVTSVAVHIIAQSITRHYACQPTVGQGIWVRKIHILKIHANSWYIKKHHDSINKGSICWMPTYIQKFTLQYPFRYCSDISNHIFKKLAIFICV